jgi:hypothetical protein
MWIVLGLPLWTELSISRRTGFFGHFLRYLFWPVRKVPKPCLAGTSRTLAS